MLKVLDGEGLGEGRGDRALRGRVSFCWAMGVRSYGW
jgi:hypothetical protein